ncbi:TPA: hypothetical protein N0F65_011323 [Lagenidium giganteum]|uniref:Peptidase M14 domain-containing protein n=1 Tax=Lagenidium giganteum TaxID=4803 RepID=A0AAV2YHX8_9STRA|nr:TPA: hypothetical protein N0F65_011323 [Lagenidium giganteum]
MHSGSVRFRANRFRQADDVLLPPPLPLIKLPDEVRQARTGLTTRPTHLPVRRHIEATVTAGNAVDAFQLATPTESELVFEENRAVVDAMAEQENAVPVRASVHVYEYNQPEVFHHSGTPPDTLVFDSLFESGNLLRAHRIFREDMLTNAAGYASRQEYELMIHPDIKNSAYRQWFYFDVKNGRPGVEYKFSLINLAKSGALFGSGLQPVVYSERNASTKRIGWVHRGYHVRYDVSVSPNSPPGTNTLSFKYRFENENDTVYFACLQPYTYTDLMEYLDALERDPDRSVTFRRTELCQTIAQNSCDILSITSPGKNGIPHEERRVIVISARVHPGEPNSSWMMKGMIDYLTGLSSGAIVLRNNFIFKVVPMLNPDGVVNGNTRVNLAGWDLNRKWSYPVEKLFPTVFHLKKLIATLQTRDRVAIYCDLHGHSINKNIFTYGCYNKKGKKKDVTAAAAANGNANAVLNYASIKNDPRVFPMIVARNSELFSFDSCDFKVHKSKLNTARVVVNHELGVINSYTLEASFCGPDFGPRKDTQFSTLDLEEMGRTWCQSLLIYFDLLPQVRTIDTAHDEEPIMTPVSPLCVDTMTGTMDESQYLSASKSLLSDCEAAISELFHLAQLDGDEDADYASSAGSNRDLSDAEDPIPPSNGPDEVNIVILQPLTKDSRSFRGLLDTSAIPVVKRDGMIHNGYSSAPEEYTTGVDNSVTKKVRRKSSKRKLHKKGSKKKKKNKNKTGTTSTPPSEMAIGEAPPEHIRKYAKRLLPKSKKKGRSKSYRRKKSTQDTQVEDDDDAGEVDELEAPVSASRAEVILPDVPRGAGRRLRTAPSPTRHSEDKTKGLGDENEYRDPTPVPPSKPRLVKIGSGVPLELPLVKPLSRGVDLRKQKIRESFERIDDAGSSDSDHDDDDDDDESDSSERSQPESCVSEF